MDTRIKLLVGAITGAVVGYFVGGAISMQLQEQDYQDGNPEEFDEEQEAEELTFIVEKGNGVDASIRNKDYSKFFKPREDLEELASKYKAPKRQVEEVEDDESDADEFETYQDETPSPIKVIHTEDYQNPDNGYEKIELFIHEDDVICDENDEPVEYAEKLVGEETLDKFGPYAQQFSGDPDVIYIRNTDVRADYMVTRYHRPYHVETKKKGRKAHAEDAGS